MNGLVRPIQARSEVLMLRCLNPIHRPPPISGSRGPCRCCLAHYDQSLARSMLGQGPQERPTDTIQRPLAKYTCFWNPLTPLSLLSPFFFRVLPPATRRRTSTKPTPWPLTTFYTPFRSKCALWNSKPVELNNHYMHSQLHLVLVFCIPFPFRSMFLFNVCLLARLFFRLYRIVCSVTSLILSFCFGLPHHVGPVPLAGPPHALHQRGLPFWAPLRARGIPKLHRGSFLCVATRVPRVPLLAARRHRRHSLVGRGHSAYGRREGWRSVDPRFAAANPGRYPEGVCPGRP